MFATHTVLFLDYQGYFDWDMYTATCIPEAMELFFKDHPDRTVMFVARGLKPAVMNKFAQAYGSMLSCNEAIYQGVCQEGTTEYIFTHDLVTFSDDNAKFMFELGLQEAQAAREDAGGFPLEPLGLYRVFPNYELVYAYITKPTSSPPSYKQLRFA